jgi:DNA processing protein
MTQSIDATRTTIIALTTSLGLAPAERQLVAPLTPSEWKRLVATLERESLPLAELPLLSPSERLTLAMGNAALAHRLGMLLDRLDSVRVAARDLDDRRIWVLTTADTGYPERWRAKLGAGAPPVLFGVGSPANLGKGSIGIVGSRDISPALARIADDLGAAAVHEPYVVISGGARGTDRHGMVGALEVGGSAVAIVPDHLQRDRLRRQNHDDIEDERLTMVSVVDPDAPFAVGNAMSRNRLIYALSELTIVLSTSGDGGGTWAGATANLKQRWAPLAVWVGPHGPVANRSLAEKGAHPFDEVPHSRSELSVLVTASSEHFIASAPPLAPDGPAQMGMPGFTG